MECSQIDLYEFLSESELQHYYNAIKNELKITNAAQLKYATDEDLKHIGLSRPEIRRLRKYYERHFPHGYLSKIKRLLQAPTTMVKRDDGSSMLSLSSSSHASAAHGGASAEASSAAKYATNSPSKVPNNKHIIPADAISVNKQLGTGEFGIVQQGVWTNGTERIQVAIKCLCRERMQSNPMEFLKEAAIMHSIEHENIVRLYGVVLATDSLMLVTELAHLRSLLECLKDSGLRVSFLTIPTLCEFAMQICNGMRYLENKRLIHRDLAARNILVFSKNKVKISDFGLSRALGVGKDYYKTNFNVNLKLPIAWCAPECINYLRFTNASDVWAYGVCLWEMFSYGFQPWAALTGLQILEAIDAPNYQRLEQPDCCPQEYYTLLMKCWQDDPAKRPRFSEIYEILPEMKPEQLKTVVNCCEPKKDHLLYRQGEIVTVLDRNTGSPFWKGVLNSGKTGYFNPSNTVAYLEGLPCANRDSFCRISERSSKRKLRTEMISKPQNDFKHTGHVGIDGDSFGDVAFLSNSQNYNHVPRQIVTPYKPSEDIEQTPLLLPPTPTSPDSLQTASGYFPDNAGGGGGGSSTNATTSMNPSFISSTENTPKHFSVGGQSSFEFPTSGCDAMSSSSTNPFAHRNNEDGQLAFAMQNNNYGIDGRGSDAPWRTSSRTNAGADDDQHHEYHEISDDEITADKLDFGPSLLDEINSMFGSMSAAAASHTNKSSEFEQMNKKNSDLTTESCASKLTRKTSNGGDSSNGNGHNFGSSTKKKSSSGTVVKPISVKDEKMLNHAIEIANEISARSMCNLVSEPSATAQSPKRKFSFRFPHLTNNEKSSSAAGAGGFSPVGSGGGNGASNTSQFGTASPSSKKKNFTEELQSIPDLQTIIGEEGREAYNSLIERKTAIGLSPTANLLRHLNTNEFEIVAAAKTLPRRSVHLHNECDMELSHAAEQMGCTAEHHLSIPLQNAPRPMTLPTRRSGAASRSRKSAEFNMPLKGASPSTDPDRGKENEQQFASDGTTMPPTTAAAVVGGGCGDAGNTTSPCESPSYLSSTTYKFSSEPAATAAASVAAAVSDTNHASKAADTNPIPLPPRDGKKHIKTNPKRHVRKYPLIIPANGVQRTLNKVTEMTPTDDELKTSASTTPSLSTGKTADRTFEVVATIRPNQTSKMSQKHAAAPANTYQNIEEVCASSASGDSASLQFESILEADFNKGNVLQSPDVTDGFYNFSIHKELYNKSKAAGLESNKISGLYVNEEELWNLDMEKRNAKITPTAHHNHNHQAEPKITPKLTSTANANDELPAEIPQQECAAAYREKSKSITAAENELAGNALFKKVRESVNMAMGHDNISIKKPTKTSADCAAELTLQQSNNNNNNIAQTHAAAPPPSQQTESEYFAATAARLADSNSVSCEDLLEFSDMKPKGCERGVDSDEVRIMMKVLGKEQSTPTRCLSVLEFIDWDVHKAIKIIKLQNILPAANLNLSQSVQALQKYEWDLHATAIKFKSF